LDGATHSPVPRIGWGHPLSGTKDWMGPPTLRYQGNVDGPWYAPENFPRRQPRASYPTVGVVANGREW